MTTLNLSKYPIEIQKEVYKNKADLPHLESLTFIQAQKMNVLQIMDIHHYPHFDFWYKVLACKDYQLFYDKYKKKEQLPNEESSQLTLF